MSSPLNKKSGENSTGLIAYQKELPAPMVELDEDYRNYLDMVSPKKRMRIMTHMTHLRHGMTVSAPVSCAGPPTVDANGHKRGCLWFSHCPIPEWVNGKREVGELKDYPIGLPCVLERLYVQQMQIDYVQQLDVDPDDPVDMSYVNQLCVVELLKHRALRILSDGDRDSQGMDFMRVDVTGYSDSGNPITSSGTHPAFDAAERLEKQRDKILREMMATRKSKADYLAKIGGAGDKENKILDELRALREALMQTPKQIKDDEFVQEILLGE